MKTPARHLLAALSLTWLLAPGFTVASQTFKAASGELLMPSADGKNFVQGPSGHLVELPLHQGSRVSDFRSAGDDWLVAAVSRVDGEPRLELLRGRGVEITPLPAPGFEPVAELQEPLFVAGTGGIQALVWLAGDAHHQLAVRTSRWTGAGWGQAETLSPPGKGTQIALSTAVLGDGSWLVLWAAFDGNDDEILWSRFADGAWSPPRPVAEDNAVPDVTPTVTAVAGGALAAWSRWDGRDYRVNVARFDGERWSQPSVAGPRGSVDPAFSDADRPYLLYRNADPAAWSVIELDANGAALRDATLAVAEPQRPVLERITEQGVRFEWISRQRMMVSEPAIWVDR